MLQLLTYLSCCLLLVSGTSLAEPEEEYFEPVEPADTVPCGAAVFGQQKINWSPSAEGEDPLHQLVRKTRAAEQQVSTEVADSELSVTTDQPEQDVTAQTEATAPRDDAACPSSAERGLTRLIRNARPLLPLDRLRNILAHAAEDAEVRELLKLLRSEQFKERVKRLRATREEGILRDFICQGLKLNHGYFLEYVRVFLNLNTQERPTGPLPQRRRGVRGLLQDLRDSLPRAQLRDLYRRQLAADSELATAVRRLRSSEFRRLLSNVRGLPEYRVVRIELERAGVPLQEVLNLVANALGWGALDLGSETLIVSA
ncbi:hypothetical protein KR222_002881 [Zaprionus bogoriensis]|nr:hypothetical protein KR222_002881 [Zaprionus bogoriensis]